MALINVFFALMSIQLTSAATEPLPLCDCACGLRINKKIDVLRKEGKEMRAYMFNASNADYWLTLNPVSLQKRDGVCPDLNDTSYNVTLYRGYVGIDITLKTKLSQLRIDIYHAYSNLLDLIRKPCKNGAALKNIDTSDIELREPAMCSAQFNQIPEADRDKELEITVYNLLFPFNAKYSVDMNAKQPRISTIYYVKDLSAFTELNQGCTHKGSTGTGNNPFDKIEMLCQCFLGHDYGNIYNDFFYAVVLALACHINDDPVIAFREALNCG